MEREDHEAQVRRIAEDLDREVEIIGRLRNLGRADDAAEAMEQELDERPLCIEREVTYRVTLGTGGPAYGVDWDDNGNARAWYQDWFTGKTFFPLDSDTAEFLASRWGVEEMLYEDEHRDDARSGW